MKFSVKTQVDYRICKNLWQVGNHGQLPQIQRIQDFACDHQVQYPIYVIPGQHTDLQDMHVMTVNSGPISIQQLCATAKTVAACSRRYLWIAINKFFVYSEHAQNLYPSQPDWDLKLLSVLADELDQWRVLDRHYRSDDRGHVGNFDYPVTALVLERP